MCISINVEAELVAADFGLWTGGILPLSLWKYCCYRINPYWFLMMTTGQWFVRLPLAGIRLGVACNVRIVSQYRVYEDTARTCADIYTKSLPIGRDGPTPSILYKLLTPTCLKRSWCLLIWKSWNHSAVGVNDSGAGGNSLDLACSSLGKC